MKKPGRPTRDWDALYKEWLVSGLPRLDFLDSKGIQGRSGNGWRRTRVWDVSLQTVADRVLETKVRATRKAEAEVLNSVILPKDAQPPGREAAGVPEAARPSARQIIDQWRSRQAMDDVKLADALRQQIKILLSTSTKRTEVEAPDGTKTVGYTTSLRPHEIKALTQAAADIQRVQRLALGLSTDNLGINDDRAQPESHVEKNVTPAEDAPPVFEVLMSKNGKFVRARPRRAS